MRSGRLSGGLILVSAIALVALFVSPAAAVDYGVSSDCSSCHGGGATFSVMNFDESPVDYSACNSCHWIGNHWRHAPFTECNSCHAGWPSRSEFNWYGNVAVGGYGYFTSAASVNASAEEIHDIHANGSWPQEVATRDALKEAKCASCHAAAACDACHEDPVGHEEHAVPGYPAVDVTVCSGTPLSSAKADSVITQPSMCVNESCHSLATATYDTGERYYEENDGSFVFTGSWSNAAVAGASGGSVAFTGGVGATATVTFEGPGDVTLLAMTRNINGRIAVSLDGGEPTVVDTYSQWAAQQVPVYTAGGVAAGTHTLTIAPTGTSNGNSYGTYVWLDAVKVVGAPEPAGDFLPACTAECHEGTVHDLVSSVHTATVAAAGVYSYQSVIPTVSADVSCVVCHSMDLKTEHERATSSSAVAGCTACHPSMRESQVPWDDTCQTAECHASGSGQEAHTAVATLHAPQPNDGHPASCSEGPLAGGRSCHEMADMSVAHSGLPDGGCTACHGTALYPDADQCSDCHSGFNCNHCHGMHP